MEFFRRLTFLVCTPVFDAEDLEGARVEQIMAEIQRLGFEVVRAPRVEDAEIVVQTDAAIGCVLVDWGRNGQGGEAPALIDLMRRRGLEMPIVILVRGERFEDIPVDVLDYIDGYVFLAEETPTFIARNLVSRLKRHGAGFDCILVDPPFFSATSAGTLDLNTDSARLINKVRPLVNDGGWLVAVNNALYVSGQEYLHTLEGLCADGYLSIETLIPVPPDFTGFPGTRVGQPPVDSTPFNHSTKIAVLRVTRKDQKTA